MNEYRHERWSQGYRSLIQEMPTMAAAKKKHSIPTLEERIIAMEEEIDEALDALAEERRPKGEGSAIPGGALRRMWEAKAAGNIFYAWLIACKEKANG
jgi:hypothetical protein